MKKLIAIALAGVLALSMAACGAQSTETTATAAAAAAETAGAAAEAAKLSGHRHPGRLHFHAEAVRGHDREL